MERMEKDAREKWVADMDKPLNWEHNIMQQGAAGIDRGADFDTPLEELERLR